MLPRPTASAVAEPDIPAKMMEATTQTWPSPPVMWPTQVRAKSKRRLVIPPVFMMLPARMKRGIASKVKLSTVVNIF